MTTSSRPTPLRSGAARPGVVDYRLARNSVIASYQRGRLDRIDVCDAQPELLRVATNVGRPAGEPCPICEEHALVHVTFVFGRRLPPSGRCVTSLRELNRLARSGEDLKGYVVEVCPECRWNHLVRAVPVGRSSRAV